MHVTAALKSWLVANCGVKDTATDAEFTKAASDAMMAGKLTGVEYAKLCAPPAAAAANEFAAMLKTMNDNTLKLIELQTVKTTAETDAAKSAAAIVAKAAAGGTAVMDPPAVENPLITRLKAMGNGRPEALAALSLIDELAKGAGADDKTGQVRVKGAWENYGTTKSALAYPDATRDGKPHALRGRPVMDPLAPNRPLDQSSEQERAVIGAFCKMLTQSAKCGSKTLAFHALPQHDRELLLYAMENYKWGGSSDGGDYADIENRRLTPGEQKALIDDSVSGGIDAAPIVFDDQVIRTPLLNGELYPYVNTIPLDRGRRIEGVITLTVTSEWGGVDSTAIDLFNTASYVSAFDTTVYRWQGAIQVGLDFLSDTPIDFGAHLTAQYGERLLTDLDNVIFSGNGTTQPEGFINHAGVTSVSFGGAAATIGDYESLMYGIPKSERRPGLAPSTVFVGSDTSYARAKGIPVSATDTRRVFGSYPSLGGTASYLNWSIMDQPYKINNSAGNTTIGYAILARYRMYRRRGLTMRTSTEGQTLILANSMLMVVMARYGGQLERGPCAVVTTTAQA